MLVAIASIKGSPGVTTLVVGLAAQWPRPRPAVVFECDPAGGDLTARFGLAGAPSLVDVAAEARRGRGVDLERHVQALPGGVALVPAPTAAEQARAALAALDHGGWLPLRQVASRYAVIVDCGRWDGDSPSTGLLRMADVALLVARPEPADVARLHARLPIIGGWSGRVGLVLRAAPGYAAADVSEALSVPVTVTVPDDPRGAAVLSGQATSRRGLSRLPLLRAAGALAIGIANQDCQTPNAAVQRRNAPARVVS